MSSCSGSGSQESDETTMDQGDAEYPPGDVMHLLHVVDGVRADEDGEDDDLDYTLDVPYLEIVECTMLPWFMTGLYGLQQENVSFPKHSHIKQRTLADIHRNHPRLAFSYGIEAEDGSVTVISYEMISYESAGLWADENGYPCLVVQASFEDGETNMLLLYSYNLKDSQEACERECDWCELGDLTELD